MFVVPITGKISWRNPPAVTILIILINCLVYFVFQDGDLQRLYEAEQYYFDSGLAQIEIPLYLEYRDQIADKQPVRNADRPPDENAFAQAYRQLEADAGFRYLLRNNRIVTPAHPEFRHWQHLRRIYNDMLESVVTRTYGFRPAFPYLTTFFSYMFLHGSFGHLLGNMLFLWIVGCVLEAGCGRRLYLAVYILGGVLAVVFYWLVHMQSTLPLVGASGAIAGLMGAYTVLFGKKKVSIFYSLGFYFNYLRMPAIVLLPVWIGKELFQLFFGTVGHIAYVAHIGGLLAGAIMGLLILRFVRLSDREVFKNEAQDDIAPLLEQALEKMGELDLDGARQLLKTALEKDPENLPALNHLFNIEKHEGDDPRFHKVAGRLLGRLCKYGRDAGRACGVYREYLKHAPQPKLSAELYLRISAACLAAGDLDRSAKILAPLVKKRPGLPGLSTALLKLAEAYRGKGRQRQADRCLQIIIRNYPDSPEAKIARDKLNPNFSGPRKSSPTT